MREDIVRRVEEARHNFLRVVEPLDESNSSYCPTPDMWTAAEQVFHAGSGINWFREGIFGAGFAEAHEAHAKDESEAKSLKHAVDHFNGAMDLLIDALNKVDDSVFKEPVPEDAPINGKKGDVISNILDHTAHHRGALQTYVRLLGKTPNSPYLQKTGAGNQQPRVPHI